MSGESIRVHLGKGVRAQQRYMALKRIALRHQCIWNGLPSIGRLIVTLADEEIGRLAAEEAPKPRSQESGDDEYLYSS